MYMRLAFAVAAHLEPEVLVVDEVLAVGDAAFQKKCLGKMGQVARSGRTVLFVSHNMAAVQSLCQRAVLLEKGRVVKVGSAGEVVRDYLSVAGSEVQAPLRDRVDRTGDGTARLTSVRIEDADGRPAITMRSRLKITMEYESDKPLLHPGFLVQINELGGTPLFGLNSDFTGGLPETMPACGQIVCLTDPINLTPGRCTIDVEVFKGLAPSDIVRDAASFDVETEDLFGTGKAPGRDWVLCALPHRWQAVGETDQSDNRGDDPA
jgi:lipopolysaccharide transport system ATP-binding protein